MYSTVLHGGGCALPRNTKPHLETGATPQGRRGENRHSGHLVGGSQGCCQYPASHRTAPRQRTIQIKMPGVLREKPCFAASSWGWEVWLAGCVCWSWRGFRIRTDTLTQNPSIRSDSWNDHPCSLPPPSQESEVNGIPAVRGPWAPSVCGSCIASRFPVGSERPSARGTVSSLCSCPLSTS